ncbi:MAG TPA: hypothetical protein ENF50_03605 [Archaeoglobus veneficus]|nr:hypothetical protein [Archaeoglobus veneficus]
MSERDILLDRLERKLAEKEKEVEELKKILSLNEQTLISIKKEIANEIKDEILNSEKFKNLELKLIELSKTVDSLTKEMLYLKSELKTENKNAKDKRYEEEIIIDRSVEEVEFDDDEDIIVCD